MQELRVRQSTAIGRKNLKNVLQLNTLWLILGIGKGTVLAIERRRKNLFDLRRVAVVHNLHVIARMDKVRPITPGIKSNSWTG